MRMRTLVGAILWSWTLSGAFAVGGKTYERALSLTDAPVCGIQCLSHTYPPTGCAIKDDTCLCDSEELSHTWATCMLANCSMEDTLNTHKVRAAVCGLSRETKTHEVLVYTIAVFSVAVIFVTLRVAGKTLAKRLSIDDYMIMVAMLLTAVPFGCILAITESGFGRHIWDLQSGHLKRCLMLFSISWSTYVIVLGLIKVSLILFYLQIFMAHKMRTACYASLVFIVTSTLGLVLATVMACIPIQAFWNRDLTGKCLDINALAYSTSGIALAQDLIILILPMPCVWKLNIGKYKKLAVGLMFAIGTFGCIATMIRVHALLSFRISTDPTWDYVPVTVWTELELGCGFICVSLPSIRVLLTVILPRRFLDFFATLSNRSCHRSTSDPLDDAPPRPAQHKKKNIWLHISTDAETNASGSAARSAIARANSEKVQLDAVEQVSTPEWNEWNKAALQPGECAVLPNRASRQQEEWELLHRQISNPDEVKPVWLGGGLPGPARPTELCQIGCLPEGSYSDTKLTRIEEEPV
ncbi:hypothetical protein K491DRAFT_608145 [Lophiostoma macrostomum CBS 122681]|uniref:Uncharacterized protein n=1 Tax=Lophiostoma macrostomum CBS 122681 TaxID=1314788 RepID=A0A6A6SUP3_9PLEO|nr:hypothetical protein K491DRAFT_608145 [Lophiostoma macrostomum CBS 122681]